VLFHLRGWCWCSAKRISCSQLELCFSPNTNVSMTSFPFSEPTIFAGAHIFCDSTKQAVHCYHVGSGMFCCPEGWQPPLRIVVVACGKSICVCMFVYTMSCSSGQPQPCPPYDILCCDAKRLVPNSTGSRDSNFLEPRMCSGSVSPQMDGIRLQKRFGPNSFHCYWSLIIANSERHCLQDLRFRSLVPGNSPPHADPCVSRAVVRFLHAVSWPFAFSSEGAMSLLHDFPVWARVECGLHVMVLVKVGEGVIMASREEGTSVYKHLFA
jgi:hypothetical protein